MQESIFTAALSAAATIFVLCVMQVAQRQFQFWPPPTPSSWQSHTFRTLFRVFVASLILLSVLDFDANQKSWRYVLGAMLLLPGFGFAFRWTNFLGWGNAFGNSDGLKTTGIYQLSRNPVYIVTIVGMLGWGLLVNSWMVSALLCLWASLYLAAPFLEEPWIKNHYGAAAESYMAQVPRYGSPLQLTKYLSDHLELQVPPVVITCISAGVMFFCAQIVTHRVVASIEARGVIAAIVCTLGIAVVIAAVLAFRRHKTTVNPLRPTHTSHLVTNGIYSYSRNPMYLSMFLVLLSWGLLLGQLSALSGIVLYLTVITRLQILPEEKVLEQKFGCTYLQFLSASNRWFGMPN